MKLAKAILGTAMAASILSGVAFAEQIGVVDMQQVMQKYTKAQTLATEVKSKETELQKLRDDLVGQLKAADSKKPALSPVEKKNLEEKLNNQFATKFKEYREWTVGQEQVLQQETSKAVSTIKEQLKLDLVLPKQAVLDGGKDVTQDVINQLNQ